MIILDNKYLFTGILIFMGIVVLPEIEMYFKEDLAECKRVTDNMKYYRFKLLSKYFHMIDNSKMPAKDSPDYDPLFKVKPLIDLINTKSPQYFKPDKNLSVD